MPNLTRIAWLDIETTGSTLEDNALLQIGVVLTDDQLDELASIELETNALGAGLLWNMSPVVLKMHAGSGLIEKVRKDGQSTTRVDRLLDEWLTEHGIDDQHIPYAGSGVGHFDRKFIERDLPRFSKRLTYWPYDVGTLRRTLRDIVGIDISAIENTDQKPHTALADARLHLAEMRAYRDLLQGIAPPFLKHPTPVTCQLCGAIRHNQNAMDFHLICVHGRQP